MSDDAQAETPQTPDAPSDQSDVSPPEAGNQAESSGGAESPRGGEKRPAEEGHEPDPGAYVPQKRGGTSSAEPPPDDAADDDVAKAKERSYEKVTGRQSGKATDDDDRRGLDHDRDAAFADPATSQRIAKESTIILRHGLTPSYSAVSLGDYSPAMTQTVVVNLESRQIKVFKGTFAPPQLDRILRPHVRVDEFEEMRNELVQHRVIVLQGEESSGRRATAINLLNSVNAASVGVVDVERDVTLRELADGKWMEAGCGHVLEISGAITRTTLQALSAGADTAVCHLVVLAGAAAAEESLEPFGFTHRSAPADEVLVEHVEHFVELHRCDKGCDEPAKRAYVRRIIGDISGAATFALPRQPWSLVKIARRIADNIHKDMPTEILVRRDQAELRTIAIDALTAVDDEDGKVKASRRQGFRLAYAVFNSCLLTDVMEAGELLGQILPLFETREKVPDRVVFDGRIEDLLVGSMATDSYPGNGSQEDNPRRARLSEPALAGTFLDVAWNDFDGLRSPLMMWLDLLAGWNRPVVQIRAATAAGLLATFDFDELYRVLIGDWARGKLVYRQSAAYALQMAASDTRLTGKVSRQVRDWSKSPNPRLQDSAARAYGRLIGAASAQEAISALRVLAGKLDLASSGSVAIGMANLFPVAPEAVLRELATWNTGASPTRRRHADRALLLLARFAGPNASDDWPAMSKLAAGDEDLLKSLAKMWANALISSDTARGAWEPLRKWIVAADADPELAELVVRMAACIFEPADKRTIFHLIQWRHRSPESPVLKRIHDAVVPREYQ